MYYNETTKMYFNGEFVFATDLKVNPFSQSLHYGYGVFEGIRAYKTVQGTAVFKGLEHYERLKRSSELMKIPFNWDTEDLLEKTYELLRLNNLQDAYVRPLVYTDPNMSLTHPTGVNLMIAVWEWGAYLGDQQLRLTCSPYERPNPKSTHIEAKANGHYINSILATSDAKNRGFDEALLFDAAGFAAEGPGANLFLQFGNELVTPKLGNILPGITRATVLELCEELGLTCTERNVSREEVFQADAAFYCGTAAEVIGIQSLDDYSFPLAWNDTLGKQLKNAYSELVRKHPKNAPFYENA